MRRPICRKLGVWCLRLIFVSLVVFVASAFKFSLAVGAQAPFITTWKTDISGSSDDNQITIPTIGDGYDYYVSWVELDNPENHGEDGPFAGDATITFPTAGTYEVRISGDFPRIYFVNAGDKQKILTIEQWGDIAWASMEYAFHGASNLTYNATDTPNLSNVTSLEGMFAQATSFNGNIGAWDVSNVTNILGMFANAHSFNQDIGDWDVGNVTNMEYMFYNAKAFDQDLSAWDVSNVTNMRYMFAGAVLFNGDIGDWNVGNVTNMEHMFEDASAFDQDIGRWDVSNVTNMNYMFSNARAFNQDLSQWNVSNVTSMGSMFERAVSFDQNLGTWDVGNVTSMASMFSSSLSRENYDATLILDFSA